MAAGNELLLGGTTWGWVENSGLRIAVQVRGTAEQLSPNSHFLRSGPPDGSLVLCPPKCGRLGLSLAALWQAELLGCEALILQSAGCPAAQPRSSALQNAAGRVVAEDC